VPADQTASFPVEDKTLKAGVVPAAKRREPKQVLDERSDGDLGYVDRSGRLRRLGRAPGEPTADLHDLLVHPKRPGIHVDVVAPQSDQFAPSKGRVRALEGLPSTVAPYRVSRSGTAVTS
jgi:hypothetical protein